MKKTLLTILLLVVFVNSFSQGFFKESNKGINVGTELWNYGICLFPNFTLAYKKNVLAAGPSFIVYPSYNFAKKVDNVFYPTKNKFFGFHLYYQYNFRTDKVLGFFLQTNVSYEYLELLDYKEMSNNLENEYASKRVNISQTFGAGLKINMSKKLYTNLSIDLGFNYFEKFMESNASTIQTDKQISRPGIIRIGVGYRFLRKI